MSANETVEAARAAIETTESGTDAVTGANVDNFVKIDSNDISESLKESDIKTEIKESKELVIEDTEANVEITDIGDDIEREEEKSEMVRSALTDNVAPISSIAQHRTNLSTDMVDFFSSIDDYEHVTITNKESMTGDTNNGVESVSETHGDTSAGNDNAVIVGDVNDDMDNAEVEALNNRMERIRGTSMTHQHSRTISSVANAGDDTKSVLLSDNDIAFNNNGLLEIMKEGDNDLGNDGLLNTTGMTIAMHIDNTDNHNEMTPESQSTVISRDAMGDAPQKSNDVADILRKKLSESHLEDEARHAINEIGGLSDDSNGMQGTGESELMTAYKTWMIEKSQYLDQINQLRTDLFKLGSAKEETKINLEERIKEITEHYKHVIDNKDSEIDKLNSDNQSLALDIASMKREFEKYDNEINETNLERETMNDKLKDYENQWNGHIAICPMYNEHSSDDDDDDTVSQREANKLKIIELESSFREYKKESEARIESMEEDRKNDRLKIEETMKLCEEKANEARESMKEVSRLQGALEEERILRQDIETSRHDLQLTLDDLRNQYDMLFSFCQEQSAVIDKAPIPFGVNTEQYEQLKSKRILFQQPRGGKRSVVNSFGGMSEFVSHIARLSNMSELIERGALKQINRDGNMSEYSDSSFYTASSAAAAANSRSIHDDGLLCNIIHTTR